MLVASDLSEASEGALRAGARVATALGAPLVVVHGVRAQPLGFLRPEVREAPPGEPMVRAREALARQVGQTLGPEARPELHIAVGAPAEIVAGLATSLAAEVVVLGPHRPRGPLDGLLGATADRIVRVARRPCLLVNAPLVAPLRAVLVPTDLSPVAREALTLAARWLVRSRGSDPAEPLRLRLLHVGDASSSASARAAARRLLDEEVARARRLLGEAQCLVEGLTSMQHVPAQAILSAADAMPADLVVLGTRGSSGVTRLLLGSVAGAVMRTLRRPLVIVPPGASGPAS
ncbi:MAG: universal stress protein [Deltaproteobacteria bacterium]|nr:universal stress protein [Deltaproteobacteria bacterium]